MLNPYMDYPFTSNGVKFLSRVYSNSPLARTIASLPQGVFVQMNIQAVAEIIGDASLLTRDELLLELERVNAGGTHAFILLDEREQDLCNCEMVCYCEVSAK